MGEEAYEVIISRLPKLVEKIAPEQISDELLSLKIINEEQWQASFDDRDSPKKRTRVLIYAVMQAIKKDPKTFEKFCRVLKKSDKKSTQEWGDRLRGDLVKYNYIVLYRGHSESDECCYCQREVQMCNLGSN